MLDPWDTATGGEGKMKRSRKGREEEVGTMRILRGTNPRGRIPGDEDADFRNRGRGTRERSSIRGEGMGQQWSAWRRGSVSPMRVITGVMGRKEW